ncbi:MAG: M23 family metallopeptidase [Vampirovibrio sp.]
MLLIHSTEPRYEKTDTFKVLWRKQSLKAYRWEKTGQSNTWGVLIAVDPLAPAGEAALSVWDASGECVARWTLPIIKTAFPTQAIRASKETAALQPEAGELETVERLKQLKTPYRYWQSPLQFKAPVPQCVNSPFGVKRMVNGIFTGNYHKGLDQKAPQGQWISAPESGRIFIAQAFALHGGTVGIDHGQGVTSIYIHMSQIGVRVSQVVPKGARLGQVGATGFATGPHLHWGAFIQGVAVDPSAFTSSLQPCGT